MDQYTVEKILSSNLIMHFYYRSIKNYLRHKICILVTNQVQFLRDATTIIVLNNVSLEVTQNRVSSDRTGFDIIG